MLSAGFGKGWAWIHGANRPISCRREGEAPAASPSPRCASAISLHRIVDVDVAVRDGLVRSRGVALGVLTFQALAVCIAVVDQVRSDGRRSAVVLDPGVDLGVLEPGELAGGLSYVCRQVGSR